MRRFGFWGPKKKKRRKTGVFQFLLYVVKSSVRGVWVGPAILVFAFLVIFLILYACWKLYAGRIHRWHTAPKTALVSSKFKIQFFWKLLVRVWCINNRCTLAERAQNFLRFYVDQIWCRYACCNHADIVTQAQQAYSDFHDRAFLKIFRIFGEKK